jgi:hypothetical protein
MKKPTQYDLIYHWLSENEYLTPALMGGKMCLGQYFGSSLDARCRELRKAGILGGTHLKEDDGKFSRFTSFFLIKKQNEQDRILDKEI